MTIYDIPNIEHCDISMVGDYHYRIFTHNGWYIYLTNEPPGIDPQTGYPTKIYKTVAILRTEDNFSIVEITAETCLPDNAEICG